MHQKLENLMGKFGGFIHDNPLKVIIVLFALLAFPLSQVPKITMDTSTEGFMHPDDPVLLEYNAFRSQFGRDERVMVALKSENIFTLSFLQTLKKLHEELEANVPFLDDINSLYNVRNTRGEGDKLITDDLLEHFPSTQAQVDVIKAQVMASHFYKDLFISQNGKMTSIVIETDAYSSEGVVEVSDIDAFDEGFDTPNKEDKERAFLTDEENAQLINKVLEITKKYQSDDLEIFVAGSPSVNHALKSQMRADMQKFMRITFLIIIVFLFVMFRRVSAVFYPLLVIILSLLVTVGAMAWFGTAFKLPTQIVPSLLMAVSVGATVHILSIFFDKFNRTGDKKEALSYTLGHSGLAIAMTSVTTAIGVGSFAGSEVAPISDLGTFASLGVLVSLVLTLTLLPALLALTKLKQKVKVSDDRLDNLMKKLAILPIKYYKAILAGSAVLVSASIVLAVMHIELSHNPLKWFQPDSYDRISTEIIDETMNGSVTIELVIDTKETNGWNDPTRLNTLNQFSKDLESYVDSNTHIGKVISLATIVKETNRALHENKEAYYVIPKNTDLVSQELLLFENSGSDDLEDVVDSQFSKARVSIKLPWTDAVKAVEVLTYVKEEAKKRFPNDEVVATGMIPLLINTFSQAISSSVASYIIAFIAISFMMMLIMGSVRIGLLSMIPNLAPIIVGLLLMVIFGIPLDMFTLLIGSIAIGLAVDDTIHFMHNFRRYYLKHGDASKAIEETFFTTGKAMLITSIVLSLGFFAYIMANMISVQNFGLLTGSVIVLALLSDLLLAPALMMVVTKWGWIK
ncbi:Predicted exporter of the RND superfamily [hydrothermal vent metagenome]|uniref:Predicted exporter of the RND superfamily n=1 Tax=hydrothermal vent metagenome TaxID=652676 RepID=A0A1W1CZ32_9ZZZZ